MLDPPRLEGKEEEEEKGARHSKSIHPKLLKTLKNPENEYLVCWLSSGLKYHGSNQEQLELNSGMSAA